ARQGLDGLALDREAPLLLSHTEMMPDARVNRPSPGGPARPRSRVTVAVAAAVGLAVATGMPCDSPLWPWLQDEEPARRAPTRGTRSSGSPSASRTVARRARPRRRDGSPG